MAQLKPMAEQIVAASKLMDELIQHVPDLPDTEEDQLRAIAALQAKNDAVGDELREVQQQAEAQLMRVQALFGVLADAELQRRSAHAQTEGPS